MRKKIPFSYFLLLLLFLILFSLPKTVSDHARGSAAALAAPIWRQTTNMKEQCASNNAKPHISSAHEELQRLQIENSLLKNELLSLKDAMQRQVQLLHQLAAAQNSSEMHAAAAALQKTHQLQLKKLLELHLQAKPAKIIFRSPASWNSSFWIDLGEQANALYGKKIIAKNCPVITGTAVIGVVDYVGKNQARVRLITDSGLCPSVRAKRDSSDMALIQEKTLQLLQLLEKQPEPPARGVIQQLHEYLPRLKPTTESHYLAKGEMQGASKPLWRSSRHILSGHGFNYDYTDGEGPARDLRTGQPVGTDLDPSHLPPALSILKTGDLLVTTGMDGVFPPDLLVAKVTKVHPLKEGDYFYELEAVPVAGNMDDLSTVFVLPPSQYDPEDQPPRFSSHMF
jgi:rod shape-determining protein MreC